MKTLEIAACNYVDTRPENDVFYDSFIAGAMWERENSKTIEDFAKWVDDEGTEAFEFHGILGLLKQFKEQNL